jgi:Methyltransferase domain
MKKWILKAIVQKITSYLPFSNKINYVFQKYVTKGVYLSDEYFYDRLGHAKAHLAAFQKHSKTAKNAIVPKNALELGTGWYPVVPISFYLVGVETTYSVDISFLTSKERIFTTLQQFENAHKSGKLSGYLDVLPEKWAKLSVLIANYADYSLEDVLKYLNLVYLIEDARALSLPDGSVDLVNSNNTFEHIYPSILIPILKDFKRVVNKEHGIMSHFIDMSDHFAHFDKTINIYNFLQFSDEAWKWIDNDIQPMSRLRIDDYKQIYADLGINIDAEDNREGSIDELRTIKLAEKYAQKPLAIVAVSHCHFISVP